jgi:hypothetical protein
MWHVAEVLATLAGADEGAGDRQTLPGAGKVRTNLRLRTL